MSAKRQICWVFSLSGGRNDRVNRRVTGHPATFKQPTGFGQLWGAFSNQAARPTSSAARS